MNDKLQAILNTPTPAFVANIRSQSRKEWAQAVRKLFKSLGLKDISVTVPNYSQAETIAIRIPGLIVDNEAHEATHQALWLKGANNTDCQDCSQRWNARQYAEKIILAAFPDLDNRGDLHSDYHDYCLSFE